MWTTVLASYAAVVSTGSLLVSYLSLRSNGPLISGEAEISTEIYGAKFDGPALFIDIHNRGRGPVTIDSATIWAGGNTGPVKGILEIGWQLHSDDFALPLKIEGYSGAHWYFPARQFAKTWLTRNDLQSFKIDIQLSHGKRLFLKVDTSAIDRLDRQNLPQWEPDYFTNREYT